jgi:hypothetical protein
LEQGNCVLFEGTMWKLAWRDWGEAKKICFRITDILTNIDAMYLTNTSLQHYHCSVHSFFRTLLGACICSCVCQPIPDSLVYVNNTDPNWPILTKFWMNIMPTDTSQYQYFMTSCHKVIIYTNMLPWIMVWWE